jgi:EmrB/QacA subfamily drug resistance transporter
MSNAVSDLMKRIRNRRQAENTKPQAQTSNQIVGTRRWWALGAVLLTMFFSALDQTIISTAMPVIIGELQGFSLYAWTFTAYMMASAVTVPIYGKLSDVYGRKPFYVLGLTLFMVGSMFSGMVVDMPQLILARTLQGLGAGAMLSMPRATIGDIFNPRERGRWMGVIASVFGLASIVGPVMGGWITDHWGWRWVFYINLPVAGIALLAVLYALPTVKTDDQVQLDWPGSLALVAGLVPLLLAFTWAGHEYAWLSTPILGLFTAAIFFLGLFVWLERRAAEPIIAPDLFRNQIFASTALVALFMSMAMFGTIIFLPLFVQGVLGKSAQQSGQVLMPMMLSFITGSVIGGQLISRTGKYKMQAMIGTLLMVAGTFLLSRMGPDTAVLTVVFNIVVLGLGIGVVMPLLNVAVQNAFPYRMMGMVSATQQFVRSLGGIVVAPILGTVLVTIFSAQLITLMPAQLQAAIHTLPPAQQEALLNPQGLINAETQAAIESSFLRLDENGGQLYQQFITAVHQALTDGTTRLFAVGTVFAVLAFLATFGLKEMELQQDEFFQEQNEPVNILE